MAQNLSEIAVAARLEQFFCRIGSHLKDKRKRESFAMYAMGIRGDGERKSAEPIAARACADPSQTNNVHSKLCYFLRRSDWDDEAVRLEATRYTIEKLEQREPVTTWIIDDTGFLKQGKHSVGVPRQYTGSAGKITNCQIGVSLAVATSSDHFPIDFELYLPKMWAEDAALRAEGPTLARRRVAGERKRSDQVRAHYAAAPHEPQPDRENSQGTLAHGAHVRGPQRRTRSRPLRRALVPGLPITCPSSSAAMPSSSPSASALFPPRPDGTVAIVRSASRPERHFADSFITIRLAIARFLARWLPRCPFCHRIHASSHCRTRHVIQVAAAGL
ncbi:MAG TPA: transposase [Polyangiaceae bacterium]|nr:transposase [Polyangiaceae bacterium]